MWLPRTLPFANAKAGSNVLFVSPSASHAAVRVPVSVPHAAAPEVAHSPADELLKLATAARLRRQQQAQQQQPQQQYRQIQKPQQQYRQTQQPQEQRVHHNQQPQQQQDGSRQPNKFGPQRSPRQPFIERDEQQRTPGRTSSATRAPDGNRHGPASEAKAHGKHEQAPKRQRADNHSQPLQQSQPQQQQQRRPVMFAVGSEQDWSLPTGLAVTWLGTSSGAPTKERNISCTLVRVPEAVYMVDCGEGSYKQIKKTGIQLEQVDTIFMTHLHGDHCFGIGSMLISLNNARRAAMQQQQHSTQQQHSLELDSDQGPDKLRVVGPPRLGQLMTAMLVGAGVGRKLDMPVYVTEFVDNNRHAHSWQPLPGCPPGQAFLRRLAPEKQQLEGAPWLLELQTKLDNSGLDWESHPANTRAYDFIAKHGLVWRLPCQHATVSAAQLQHRVPCWGYVFDEQQQPQQQHQIGHQQQQQGRRVVILGDTVDSGPIAPIAYGADVVSHEATFAAGMEGKAAVAQHSTAWMAGQFADAIQAKALVLTHFSARYEGSMQEQVPGHRGKFGHQRGPGSAGADAEEREKAAEQRAVKALAKEAEAHYGGQVLLAIDLFTTHVAQQEQDE